MLPALPSNARLGTGGLAAFRDATQLFQPTNVRRADRHAWRPSQSDILDRGDQQMFSPVGQRADAGLWDVGGNAAGSNGIPQALVDNSADNLGLRPEEAADALTKKKAVK